MEYLVETDELMVREVVDFGPDLAEVVTGAVRCMAEDYDSYALMHLYQLRDDGRPDGRYSPARIWVCGPYVMVGGRGVLASDAYAALAGSGMGCEVIRL